MNILFNNGVLETSGGRESFTGKLNILNDSFTGRIFKTRKNSYGIIKRFSKKGDIYNVHGVTMNGRKVRCTKCIIYNELSEHVFNEIHNQLKHDK